MINEDDIDFDNIHGSAFIRHSYVDDNEEVIKQGDKEESNDRRIEFTPYQRNLYNKLPNFHKAAVQLHSAGWKNRDIAKRLLNSRDNSAVDKVRRALKDSRVQEFLFTIYEEHLGNAVMSKQEMLESLTNVARGNLDDFIEVQNVVMGEDVNGDPVYTISVKMREDARNNPSVMATLSEISISDKGVIKIKQKDTLAAKKQLQGMMGWIAPQKMDHTSSDRSMSPQKIDFTKLSDSALQEIMDAAKIED